MPHAAKWTPLTRVSWRWQVGSGKTKVILPMLCQAFLSNNAAVHKQLARGGEAKHVLVLLVPVGAVVGFVGWACMTIPFFLTVCDRLGTLP